MTMIQTNAWVLYAGNKSSNTIIPSLAELKEETITFPEITDNEVLVEPIYGCWEGNMSHALERKPIDICSIRNEEKVVIGNAGVVRVLKCGAAVTHLAEEEFAVVIPSGQIDKYGYVQKTYAYDAELTIGLLSKRTKLSGHMLIALPKNTKYSLAQWAAFSVRYLSAWSNWTLAYAARQLQVPREYDLQPFVWAWGGGVALAELALAKHFNCRCAIISSDVNRFETISAMGIQPINRNLFSDLHYNNERYQTDLNYREAYRKSENQFLDIIDKETDHAKVAIFIDNIGAPVLRATLKALAKPGVLATCGWKRGMHISINRALECLNRHIHIHTYGATYQQSIEAIEFAEKHGWMPIIDDKVYTWENIPQLALNYYEEKISSYFPIFQVNSI